MKKEIAYDLEAALEYNQTSFKMGDILEVLAEIPGENDGRNWWWILKIRGRGYLLFTGGCDYTGWDCQSSVEELGFFKTKLQAAKAAPQVEEYYEDKKIQEQLIKQVKTGSSFEPEMKDYR